MPHTTQKPSRIPGPLHKAGLFVLFAAITAALCLLLNFLLVDDLHAYSRVTLGEYYAQADAVDTVFVGSSHSYRSFDPDTIDPILGSRSFNLGTSQLLLAYSGSCRQQPAENRLSGNLLYRL